MIFTFFLTSWRVLQKCIMTFLAWCIFYIMTNFLMSQSVSTSWQNVYVKNTLWHQKVYHGVKIMSCQKYIRMPQSFPWRLFDVMTNFLLWHLFTSWRVFMTWTFWSPVVFLIMSWDTCWRRDIFFTSWQTFLTSWCVFEIMINFFNQDMLLASWQTCLIPWSTFDVMMHFGHDMFYIRTKLFVVMTWFWHMMNSLTSQTHHDKLTTYFWHHDVFRHHDKHFEVMMYFWCHDMFDVMTNFYIMNFFDFTIFLRSHDIFFVMTNFFTSWNIFCISGCYNILFDIMKVTNSRNSRTSYKY